MPQSPRTTRLHSNISTKSMHKYMNILTVIQHYRHLRQWRHTSAVNTDEHSLSMPGDLWMLPDADRQGITTFSMGNYKPYCTLLGYLVLVFCLQALPMRGSYVTANFGPPTKCAHDPVYSGYLSRIESWSALTSQYCCMARASSIAECSPFCYGRCKLKISSNAWNNAMQMAQTSQIYVIIISVIGALQWHISSMCLLMY